MEKGVSYYGSHFLGHIDSDIKEIKESGCTYIVLAASEFDLGFYFPATKEVVNAAHRNGLKVFLDFWAHGGAFGGEAASFFVAENPGACQITNEGRKVMKACFNNPAFVEFMKSQVHKCCTELDIDGIFWDEPFFFPFFFPFGEDNSWACTCKHCKTAFREKYGFEMPLELTDEVRDFRIMSSIRFIEELSKYVKNIRPDILVTVCQIPQNRKYWPQICEIAEVDIISTDPYWTFGDIKVTPYVLDISNELKEIAAKYGKKSEVWVQLFSIPKGTEGNISEAIDLVKKSGVDFISAWTFRAAQNSVLECGDWQKAWTCLKEGYQKI